MAAPSEGATNMADVDSGVPAGGGDVHVLASITFAVAEGGGATLSVQRDLSRPAPPEALDDSPYSYAYTGKHDGGPLPPLRDNVYGHVVDALLDLKAQSEAWLVAALAHEGGVAQPPSAKKARLAGGGAGVEEEDEEDDGDGDA